MDETRVEVQQACHSHILRSINIKNIANRVNTMLSISTTYVRNKEKRKRKKLREAMIK